jgi:hypothetical protein
MHSSGPNVKHERVQGRVQLEQLVVKGLRQKIEVRQIFVCIAPTLTTELIVASILATANASNAGAVLPRFSVV